MNSHIMDSRMLNVFHEDPFEGNFVKYDPEANFWSANDDLELTDTLNGILPIAPTDESLLSQTEAEEQLQNRKNLLIYSDFVDQQLSDDANVLNGQVYRAITDCEAEAAFGQQRQLSALIDTDDDEVHHGMGDNDRHSQCSNSTFRTRTDSSSIGDYESHSSDYDEIDEGLQPVDAFAMQEERKGRTLSTNTICSDADALGLNIDVNNFDLAEFITKDDFADCINALRSTDVNNSKSEVSAETPIKIQTALAKSKELQTVSAERPAAVLPKPVIISSKSRDSDYDSDSIIDVETVDLVDVDEAMWVPPKIEQTTPTDDLCYVDNVKADPSWCPKQVKRIVSAEHKAASATNQTAPKSANVQVPPVAVVATSQAAPSTTKSKVNICLVPNKKQCDFLKRKVGTKAVASVKPKVLAKKIQEATKPATGKQLSLAKSTEVQPIHTGLGLGGKNLALLKHERDAAAASLNSFSSAITPAPKRKLNLEEYKQRRRGAVVPPKLPALVPVKAAKVEANKVLLPAPVQKLQHSPNKAAISSIVNILKCPPSQAAMATDPITVAKNKVLRMLELKRAQQLKIIDSRVSAKVPKVTKLPPLKDIVKDTYCMEIDLETEPTTTKVVTSSKLQTDYEEIIIVSVSCNTDITIPPHQASVALRDNKTTTPSSRSLLKSSVLLYNISNGNDAGKDMTNSLIASIQSEVVKQTNCVAMAAPAAMSSATVDKNAQHGEDMVIMHLAKNRVRKQMVCMGTQTDLQPEFPLLTLPTTRESRERTRRAYRKRRSEDSESNVSSCSSSSSSSSACSSLASYRSRSNSNSTERLRHLDATAACGSSIGGGGYSSRSTRRHRSSVSSSSYSEAGKYERQQRQRRTSYNKRRSKNQTHGNCSTSGSEYSDRERSRSPLRRSRSRSRSQSATRYGNNNRRGYVDRNVSQPAVEERRIVYVGRIEQDTTKELLRRKFLPYGSIKQITIHYKENGMKYGFVTFERAQDAFAAIDTSAGDAQINMYDISFGGRRAFCRASYADLDNAGINNYHSYVFPKAAPAAPQPEDSFEALLLKVKAKLNAGKPAAAQTTAPTDAEGAPQTTDSNNKNSDGVISKI